MPELEGGTPATENEEVKSQTEAEETPSGESEEEFDEITYNKETVKIPKSQRQTFLQKGYNYDKVQGRAKTAETYLEKAARLTGYSSVDEYLKAVDDAERKAETERLNAAGITDPKLIEEMIDKHPAVQQAKRLTMKETFREQVEALKGEEFFDELKPEIEAMVKATPGLDAETAYNYLYGKNRKRLTKEATDTAAKKAVEDHKRQSKRGGVEASDDAPPAAGKLGLTAEEYAHGMKRVKQGMWKNIEEFAKALKK